MFHVPLRPFWLQDVDTAILSDPPHGRLLAIITHDSGKYYPTLFINPLGYWRLRREGWIDAWIGGETYLRGLTHIAAALCRRGRMVDAKKLVEAALVEAKMIEAAWVGDL